MKKTFLVVYAKCIGSNFAGQAPDVPGCVSAGDTLDEMRSMMKEALEGHFQVLADYGDPLPEPSSKMIDIKEEDFEGVEYFVVAHLSIELPQKPAIHRTREAILAA